MGQRHERAFPYPGGRAAAIESRNRRPRLRRTFASANFGPPQMERDAEFDPEAFGQFLAAQADLGTKWAPRYVRVTTLPVGATNKIDKRPLRAERWYTDDPVYWRPTSDLTYRRFDA